MRLRFWIGGLRDDVKYALRQLWRAPAFALVAIVTLALGIGANGAIFALVDAVLLRPLPLREPQQLVMMYERTAASPREPVSPLDLLDWNERASTLDGVAGFVGGVGSMVMSGEGAVAESVSRQWVTPSIFSVLGVPLVAGRTFEQTDRNAVVLSDAFWQRRFNRDPAVVGRSLRLDGAAYTVVGVVPASFRLFGRSDIWAAIPLVRRPELRTAYFLWTVARLKSGVTLQSARADLAAVSDVLGRELPRTNADRHAVVEPLHDALVGSEVRLTAVLFLGVVGFVLLICCSNVANLLLARATVRSRELAVRSALGASRRRLVRQLLTESVVLAGIGGALGVAVGALILRVAPALMPEDLLPSAVSLTFDARVAGFCAAATALVGIVFGLAPAWHAGHLASPAAPAAAQRTVTGGGRIRSVLVAVEVAAAVLLLSGAGLLLRTLLALEHVDRGYGAGGVLTVMVDPLSSQYRTLESLQRFFRDVEREAMKDPHVRRVAWASTLPLGASEIGRVSFAIAGDPLVAEAQRPTADYQIVSPRYFETVDLPIVAGRSFSDDARADRVPVCIVNEAFVRGPLRGRAPIGMQIAVQSTRSAGKLIVRQIVGVARQVKERPDETGELLQVYVPIGQDAFDDIFLLAQPVTGPAELLTSSIRAAIARVDTQQLVTVGEMMTLDDVARVATARHRFRAQMVASLAGLALLLAMIGVFGMLAYAVQQRLREFGVRIALGATRSEMFRLVVSSAARTLGIGAVVGLALSAALGRLIAAVLFGVRPLDPVTFASVIALLVLTAALSTAAPAWRAMRVDPAAILRGE